MQQERFKLMQAGRPLPPVRTLLLAIAPLAGVTLSSMVVDVAWPLVMAALVWLVVVVAGNILRSRVSEGSYELLVDTSGIEFGEHGRNTRIPWRQVERVAAVRTATPSGPTQHLVAWLDPNAPLPVRDNDEPPCFDQELGGIRICDLAVWDATPAEIQWVVARYAGSAWAGT